MENLAFDLQERLQNVPHKELVEELKFIRHFSLKLADIEIDKRAFKYLKKLGVYEAFIKDAEKKWQFFNLTEWLVLKISDTLWRFGYAPDVIKSIVETLVSDSWLEDFIKSLLQFSDRNELITSKSASEPISFIEYCVLERKNKPNLRAFTNIDALLIAAFATDKPISLMINDFGNWRLFTGLSVENSLEVKFHESLFKASFISISISNLIDAFIEKSSGKSSFFSPDSFVKRNFDSLISKGFDHQTFREIEIDRKDVQFEFLDLPVDSNLSKLKNQFANQEILIKIRNSKVSSLKQLVIKKNKQ
jgi:hypothetical protein